MDVKTHDGRNISPLHEASSSAGEHVVGLVVTDHVGLGAVEVDGGLQAVGGGGCGEGVVGKDGVGQVLRHRQVGEGLAAVAAGAGAGVAAAPDQQLPDWGVLVRLQGGGRDQLGEGE